MFVNVRGLVFIGRHGTCVSASRLISVRVLLYIARLGTFVSVRVVYKGDHGTFVSVRGV